MYLELVDYELEIPKEGSLSSILVVFGALNSVEDFNLLPGWRFHPQLESPLVPPHMLLNTSRSQPFIL